MNELHTITGIARLSGFAPHQVRYVIKQAHLKPSHRAGELGVMLFDAETVTYILAELLHSAKRQPVDPPVPVLT